MKNQKALIQKISKNGLYIILFLCIAAVGVAGYVMYQTNDTPTEPSVVEPFMKDSSEQPMNSAFDDSKTIEVPKPKEEQKPAETPKKAETKKEEKPKTEEQSKPKKAPVKTKSASAAAPVEEGPTQFVSAVSGKIEVPFSGDELVKSKTFGDWRTHAGIDIATEEGAKVCAIAKGVVKKVYEDEMMGHTVVIEHANGVVSTYCNLMKGVVAKVGQNVKAGDVIGGVGSSAIAECMETPHLHLEVTQNGTAIDPMSLIEK